VNAVVTMSAPIMKAVGRRASRAAAPATAAMAISSARPPASKATTTGR
jgi:hypothetical protein